MSVIGQGAVTSDCVNHRGRETALRCSKCDNFICTKCAVPTPVGMRCRDCAQLRRLPQFDVGPSLLARSGLAGLLVSAAIWISVSFVPYLRFFLAILVGVAVGETMSRLARRRVSRALEVLAVVNVLLGLVTVEALRYGDRLPALLHVLSNNPSFLVGLAVPAFIASFVAVVKLR
jgi:hypothetical protein